MKQVNIDQEIYDFLDKEAFDTKKSIFEILHSILEPLKEEKLQEDILTYFFKRLLHVKKSRKLEICWDVRTDRIFIHFFKLYNIWAKDYRKRFSKEPLIKRGDIVKVLKDSNYFLEINKVWRIQGISSKCISLLRSKVPRSIKLLVDDV